MNVNEAQPPKSKATLYIGLVCLAISAIGAFMGYSGMQAAKAGMNDISAQMDSDGEGQADRVKHDLTVPGEVSVALEPNDYLIWYKSSNIVHDSGPSGFDGFDDEDEEKEADAEPAEPVENFYGPDIKWNITGPDGACLLYTSPSPRDKRQSRMPSSA